MQVLSLSLHAESLKHSNITVSAMQQIDLNQMTESQGIANYAVEIVGYVA